MLFESKISARIEKNGLLIGLTGSLRGVCVLCSSAASRISPQGDDDSHSKAKCSRVLHSLKAPASALLELPSKATLT